MVKGKVYRVNIRYLAKVGGWFSELRQSDANV